MKIRQLHDFVEGVSVEVAPVTIPDAVVDPNTQENLTTILDSLKESVPTKTSELENDAAYVQAADLEEEIPDPEIVYAAKDLSMYDIHGEAIRQTTANCYVVSKKGLYKFPIAYGAAVKDGSVNTAAYTKVSGDYSMNFVNYKDEVITSPYIETDTGSTAASVELSMADTDGIFQMGGIASGDDCRYVAFQVNEVPATGANGVISVLDSEGVVMWSWHIWVWPDDLTPVTITNSTGVDYNILPVNLASKWQTDSSNPTQMTSWYYQWGRPTPMLPAISYNSASNAENYGVKMFAVSSGKASTYGAGIRNPQEFYISPDSPYNWFGTASYYNLWDANCVATGNSDNNVVKTVYDPCPIGFKMPNGNAFTGFADNDSMPVSVGGFNNGFFFKRNADDTTGVFFPALGCRGASDGLFYDIVSLGYVWLSSAYSRNNAYYLYFAEYEYVNPQDSVSRANGYSVRPVQE